ncbi:2-phospho-L-lactate guanylyltransferase [Phytohabitans kaempferiae]|uniref:Phosphoenolpyruvate guanylyltransferase n=1 Tax=Phytohabitans kaempferiae TaxID=1620943 RepID=A0ABV6M631_9ACTN
MKPTWGVVLPVKRLAVAKSRLRGTLDGVPHERLALALAQDTVAAALACAEVAEVLAVTDDPVVGRALAELGARVVPDVPGGGLNPAFAYGAAQLAHRPVAALAADLPALCPADLSAALRTAAGARRCFVADAPGTGTVLLTAPAGTPLDPRFGPGSAAAHRRSGAVPLAGDWPTLRRDVDTAADLDGAARLGLGPHSAAVAQIPSRPIGSTSCSSS